MLDSSVKSICLILISILVAGCGQAKTPVAPPRDGEVACELTVLSPDGGEQWAVGMNHAIGWSPSVCGDLVSIELLHEGALAAVIADSTANDGSFVWSVTQAADQPDGYKVRITDLESGTADESNTTFAINEAAPGTENYYCVSTTGTLTAGVSTLDIASFGWADEDCYGSIAAAINRMSGGDHCIIDDGVYDDRIDIEGNKSGSPNDYTVIRARRDGAVSIVNGDWPFSADGCDYWILRGIKMIDPNGPAFYAHGGAHHWKVIRCGTSGQNFLASGDSHHGLFEECYVWGGPHRYPFQVNIGAHDIIFRRCLVRWDYSTTEGPQACFANYNCENVIFQNCIAIDATDNRGTPEAQYDGLKGFFTPNCAGGVYTRIEGCIVLNMDGAGGIHTETAPNIDIVDTVIWDCKDDGADDEVYKEWPLALFADQGRVRIDRCTIGGSDIGYHPVEFDDNNHDESITNSIIMLHTLDAGEHAMSGTPDVHDYNCFWGNTGDRNSEDGIGPHSITGTNPFANGLQTLVGIVGGSALKTAGEGGGQIGAQITERIGVSGTLYGEAGWDQKTGESLWPFPYEDQIREDCRSFSSPPGAAYPGSPAMNAERGFCAPGQSLTSYILDYLSRAGY